MLYKAFPTHFSGSMLHMEYRCHSSVPEVDICAHPRAILKSSKYLLRGSSRLTSAAFTAKQNRTKSSCTTSRKTTQEEPENSASRKTMQEEPERKVETGTSQSTTSEEREGHERTDSQSIFLSKIGNVAHRTHWKC